MRTSIAFSTILALASTLGQASAEPHVNAHRRHHARLANAAAATNANATANATEIESQLDKRLEKRFDGMRFTFFDDGLGACGKTNTPADYIVALNSQQYGNGEHCWEMITVNIGGKQVQAQITDECPGCPWGGLDFSRGLFDFFAAETVGILTGSWWFNS